MGAPGQNFPKRKEMNRRRLLRRLLQGAVAIVAFNDLVALTEGFGFRLVRVSGSHHLFTHPEIPGLLNLQSSRGEAKPYQIRQLLRLVERYNLQLEDEE
jgi:predicted RNA binding protein YcfA (HicA-like mRNA interferase family)